MSWRSYFNTLFLLIFFILIVRIFFVTPYKVLSDGLAPVLKSGDYIFMSRWSSAPYERGDFVGVLSRNEQRTLRLARIVALPGDHVEVLQGRLYVNQKFARDPFSEKYRLGPAIVPPEGVFVLVESAAAPELLPVTYDQIRGRALGVWFSVESKEVISEPVWTKIRWSRIGLL